MTDDNILRMFHEAGEAAGWKPGFGNLVINYLTHFYALAAAAEREACAKVCDSFVDLAEAEKAKLRIDCTRTAGDEEDELRAMRHELTVSTFNAGISKCASAIRSRSNK